MTKFEELGIRKEILDALDDMGFKETFPIQAATIPVLLSGRDVVGQAHTGTGKTGAYLISMLQSIVPGKGIQGLIVAPTRELAIQINAEIEKFAKYMDIRSAPIYGGQGMGIQLEALHDGVEILVATPGRLIDHLKRGSIELDDVAHTVLDEADTMLDMGFIDDIQFILNHTPEEKVMSLFSATIPTEILRLSEEYLRNAKQFLLDTDDLSGEGIAQSYLVIRDREKERHVLDLIKGTTKGQCIVFCSTKIRTRDVVRMLHGHNFDAVAIEGDMSQHRREQSMGRFRQGKAKILVATDVAARGIDVPQVALVINYDVPNQEMVYFHRIGRTARAWGKGKAVTLVSYSSVDDFEVIRRQIKTEMTNLNEEMGIEVNIPDPLKRRVPSRRHGEGQDGGRRNFRRDRGPRRDGGNWQRRDGGRDRMPRRDGGGSWRRDGDRGPRRDGGGSWRRDGDRGPRRDGDGDRGPRRDGDGDRGPRRDGDGDRGPRRDGGGSWRRDGDRGPRRDGDGDRGPRRDGDGDRGPRRDGGGSWRRDGDRGPRRDGGGSWQRRDGDGDRSPRRDGNDGASLTRRLTQRRYGSGDYDQGS